MKPAPAASESAAAAPVVKTGGKYVPPNRRNESGASAVPVVVQRPRKPKVAPNIQSEMDFPTLAMAGDNQRYPTSVFMSTRVGNYLCFYSKTSTELFKHV